MSKPEFKFNPEIAAAIMRREKLKRRLLALAFAAAAVAATVAYYEVTNSYENCILRRMPGTPENAVRLIRDACLEIAR